MIPVYRAGRRRTPRPKLTHLPISITPRLRPIAFYATRPEADHPLLPHRPGQIASASRPLEVIDEVGRRALVVGAGLNRHEFPPLGSQ